MQTHDELVVKQKRKTSSDLKEAFFTQEKTHAILVTQCQLLAPQHRLAQVGPVSFSHMKARLTSLDFP